METFAQKSPPKRAAAPALLSFDEYLKREERALHRHEFHNGKRIKMAGGTHHHNLLTSELIRILWNVLGQNAPDALVYSSDMKTHVPAYNKTYYPDATVVLGSPELFRGYQSVILNPIVLVEVLSKSTENFDRNEKFTHFQTIPTLREYVLVSQKAPEVEVFFRENPTDGHWKFTKTTGMEGSFRLDSFGCEIKMEDLFRRVSRLW